MNLPRMGSTVWSMYDSLSDEIFGQGDMMKELCHFHARVWMTRAPYKVQVFLWRLLLNMILPRAIFLKLMVITD